MPEQASPEGPQAAEPHGGVFETLVLLDAEGRALWWHDPAVSGASATYIPDSSFLWGLIWELREQLAGIAHTHPWCGRPVPSVEDITTFIAIEAGLGKRLAWPIVTLDRVAEWRWMPNEAACDALAPNAGGLPARCWHPQRTGAPPVFYACVGAGIAQAMVVDKLREMSRPGR